MKNSILTFFFVFCLHVVHATTFYVDSRAAVNGNGLSPTNPYRSFSPVVLSSGDSVLFACGSVYTQSITISIGNVTFGSYGVGAKPAFSNPSNWYVFMVSGGGIRINGLQFGVSTYSGIELTGSGNIISNCLFTGMPKGIAVSGANNQIHHNTFRDGIMQPGKNGANDDVGALGICLNTGSNTTEIAWNSFIHCKAPSPDYGEDGGAVEFYGNVNGVKFHHNYAEDCCGLFEMGGGSIQNVEIYRNVLKNNYGIGGIHTTGTFAATVTNINYVNNTIFDTSGGSEVFWVYGSNGQSQVKFKNNIVYYNGFQRFSSAAGVIHQNNVFFSPAGNTLGIPPDPSDIYGVNPAFTSIADYHLTSGSVAINKGQPAVYTIDYDGYPMVGVPDAGAYEYQSVVNNDIIPPTIPTSLSSSAITSNGFILTWAASTDNVGVIGYDIYRNGVYLVSSTTTSISIAGLAASANHSMTVLAKDAAGNQSLQSSALNVMTSGPPNLLLNPGFETGTASWSGSGATIATSSIRYSGNFSLLTSSRTAAWSGPQQDVTAALASSGSGSYYTEAYVRTTSGSTNVRIVVKYSVGGVTYFARTPGVSVGKSSFKKVSGVLNLNINGALQNAVYFIESVSGKNSFYTDDCRLVKANSVNEQVQRKFIEDQPLLEVNIHPNPASDGVVFIDLPAQEVNGIVEIRIHDLNGKVVMEATAVPGGISRLSTEGLSRGWYLVNITGLSDRIIIQKLLVH